MKPTDDTTAAVGRRGIGRLLAVAAAVALGVAAIGIDAALGAHPAMAATTLRQLADAKHLKIGTAVTASNLTGIARYGAVAAREFNSMTPGNEMKWGSIEPARGQLNFAGADQIVATAAANSQAVRGHTLVWHNQLPSWLTSGGFTGPQLLQIMRQHIATEVGRYAGKLVSWDVVNEPFNEDGTLRSTIFSQGIGASYIADALTAARAADPTAKLYVNDFNIEGVNAKSTAMLNLVTSLKQQGVPIDGVGIQTHLILGQVPSDFARNIARFAALGLDVWLSEVDVRMNLPADATKLAQQSSDYTKIAQACLAVSRCVGITVWGFTDFDSWVPGTFPGQGSADIFDTNFDPKPAYNAVLVALGGTAPTPTPTPTPPPGATCKVTYRVVNQWNVGFTASIDIANLGTAAVNGWTLAFDFSAGQTVSQGWSGQYAQTAAHVTVTNLLWNSTIAPSATINTGFNGAHNGTNPVPASFTLNGGACAIA
jgi:endo-1,4-beta-xylanase